MQENSASAKSANINSKKAGHIPIKTANDGGNSSKDEINFTLSPGDETGNLIICCEIANKNKYKSNDTY